MKEIFEKFLIVLLNGRQMITVCMTLTYCYLAIFMVTKLSEKLTGDFMLGYLGGFSTGFMLMVQWFFDQEKHDGNGNNQSKGGGNPPPPSIS